VVIRATPTAVVEAMIDVDAGSGDGEFDETGSSTGDCGTTSCRRTEMRCWTA
jgi:hypothetical protein